MARVRRKRYVVRLHPDALSLLTARAEKKGYLTATFISAVLEEITPKSAKAYRIYDEDGVYQLKRGPGPVRAKQTSVYLTDKTYAVIGEISDYLRENKDRTMSETFVIRDLLTKWLDENEN